MGVGVSASYRFDGTITEAQFAIINKHRGDYVEGCAPSADTGTREVTVASGTVWALGGADEVSGATVALPENTSGQPRIDTVVASIDYSANSTSITYVQGTPGASPVPPTLTRTAGTLWQVPLADVTVANGAGVLAASAVQDVRPGPWHDFTPEGSWSASSNSPAYRLSASTVQMRGQVIWPGATSFPTTTSSTQSITSLPYRWRPSNTRRLPSLGHPQWWNENTGFNESVNRVDVGTEGTVRLVFIREATTTTARWLSLDAVQFDISDNGRL